MKNIAIILIVLLIASCSSDKKTKKTQDAPVENNNTPKEIKSQPAVDFFNIDSPANADTIVYNSTIDFKISLKDNIENLDSISIYIDGKSIFTSNTNEFSVKLAPEKVGSNVISMEGFKNGTSQKSSIKLFILSDLEPKKLKFKLLNTFPHSTSSFTEGFIYHEGLLYESSGLYGKSALYVSKLESGEVIQSTSLPSDIFGEGIAILNNKITQLTYTAMKGFVYNKNTLRKIQTFDYPFYSEGWGLTTDNKDFIMSNGSDKIKVLDSLYFSPKKEITVCDNKESVDSLNELEYVQGILYSNIWMNNKIAQIDYKTGRVLGYLDLTSIIPKKYQRVTDDVLNGIAYNEKKKTLLVTGKNWDRIFEIKLEE